MPVALVLFILFSFVGGYLWALRGGNFFRKGKSTQVNRLFYFLPTMALVGLGFKILFPIPFPMLEFAGAALIMAVGIILGHGLFMDMGRYVSPLYRKETEAPFSWFFGAAYYDWPRPKRFHFDFAGMAFVGFVRHAWAWALAGTGISLSAIVAYQLLGILHPVLYELGHRLGENPKWNKRLLNVAPDKTTLYGELFIGTLQWCGLILFALWR